jgi:hypothetical protein
VPHARGGLRFIVSCAAVWALLGAADARPLKLQPLLEGKGRVVTVDLESWTGQGFTVDPSTVRLSLSNLDSTGPPLQLLANESGIQTAIVRDAIHSVSLNFSVPPGTAAGMYGAAIESRDARNVTMLSPGPELVYVSSAGDSPDGQLHDAIREFVGVTRYAAVEDELSCKNHPRDSLTVARGAPLRAVSIHREEYRAGPGRFFREVGDPNYLEMQPLSVEFAPIEVRYTVGWGGPWINQKPTVFALCGSLVATYADPWEMRRMLFERSPLNHPEWPAKVRAAVKDGTVIPGMTHEMVANAIGYPSVYATIAAMNRLRIWDYEAAAPFEQTVRFKGDRVISYDPPGQLP